MSATNMVMIGEFVNPTISRKFIAATEFVEGDWITMRLTTSSISKIRLHVIRRDGTDDNIHFEKRSIEQMNVYRLVNILRQITHNLAGVLDDDKA